MYYRLLTVTPTHQFSGVWASPSEKTPGKYVLKAEQLDGIGVAEMRSNDDDSDVLIDNVVVGLWIDHCGEWQIANDHDNYGGMIQSGTDPTNAHGLLPQKTRENLIVEE